MKSISVTVSVVFDILHNEALDSEWVATHLQFTDRFSTKKFFGDKFDIVAASSSVDKVWLYDSFTGILTKKLKSVRVNKILRFFNPFGRKTTDEFTEVETCHFIVTNKTTGDSYPFDYRSEAEDHYKALVKEYGNLYEYELTVCIKQHQPPEMLNAGKNDE